MTLAAALSGETVPRRPGLSLSLSWEAGGGGGWVENCLC